MRGDGCDFSPAMSNLDALGSLPPSNDGKDNNYLQEVMGGGAPIYICEDTIRITGARVRPQWRMMAPVISTGATSIL